MASQKEVNHTTKLEINVTISQLLQSWLAIYTYTHIGITEYTNIPGLKGLVGKYSVNVVLNKTICAYIINNYCFLCA